MLIVFDIIKNQLVFNHQQIAQDADFARLKMDFGWRGVKFCIDYFWNGSPYANNEDSSKLKLAYKNAIDWFPDESRFEYKNEAKYLRLDNKDCYVNLEIFKKCGEKVNELFRMPALENFNNLLKKEEELQYSLSFVNIKEAVTSDDDDLVKKRTESAKNIGQALSTIAKLRHEAEIELKETLSEAKIASLDTFLN